MADTVKLWFPDIKCCECSKAIAQGATAAIHPTKRGPKGGKKYCHTTCLKAR